MKKITVIRMRIEIDQSVKIEQLSRDTIIALSNDIEFTVTISSKIKRKLQQEFRTLGKQKLFRYRTFMAGVVLLVHYAPLKNIPSVTLDREYAGHEKILRSMFFEMWTRYHSELPMFEIKEIGKRSRAHDVGYRTLKGKKKVDRKLTYTEVRKLALK
ncbi:MAG: hypothetical protein AAB649_06270 [Patescibacteria group bacterium]